MAIPFPHTSSRGFASLLRYASQQPLSLKSLGPEIWARKASQILLIDVELQPEATASSAIRSFAMRFLLSCYFASTSPIFFPNGVDSFAWAAMFRLREGVVLPVAENGRFPIHIENLSFFGLRTLATKPCQIRNT